MADCYIRQGHLVTVFDNLFLLRQLPVAIVSLIDNENSPFVGPSGLTLANVTANYDEITVLATLNYDKIKMNSVIGDPWHYINSLSPRQGTRTV